MKLATRLLIAIGLAMTGVMVAYALIALRQREALLVEALQRETETLGRTLQITTNNALRDGRFQDLEDVLAQVTEDPETFVAAVLSSDGEVLAGGPLGDLRCLGNERSTWSTRGFASGWADCGGRVRWVTLEARSPGSVLIVARRATVIERDMVASRWRMGITTLALAFAAGVVILVVVRTSVSSPLEDVMRAIHSLGEDPALAKARTNRVSGEIGQLATAFNDMSSRLQKKEASLLQEVEERLSLERKLRQTEKLAAVGRLTGGIAHEIGSPLNVIGVRAESILALHEDAAHGRRQAEEILSEVDRLARLVRGLTHVARRHPIERRPVDLVEVAESAFEEVSQRPDLAAIVLNLHPTGRPATVTGDETLLRHALLNLLTNSLHSLTSQGGGQIDVRIAQGDPTEDERAQWMIVVEDDGPGIRDADLPHVFEPFWTTKDVGEGMGLGLAVCSGIVEEHGGALEIEPREGGGVRAIMTLPADDA